MQEIQLDRGFATKEIHHNPDFCTIHINFRHSPAEIIEGAIDNANSFALTEGDFDARGTDLTYNPAWKNAVKKGKGTYTVEMAVPYAAVMAKPPSPGDVWRINVIRNRAAGAREMSAWSCPFGKSRDIDRYGYLFFTEPSKME